MIKFVYFDVGGVTVADFSKTNKWEILKKEIGVTQETNQKFEDLYNYYEPQINTTLHINDFYKIVQSELNLKTLSHFNFLIDGFIKRFNKNKSLWPVVKEIQNNCKIGLLTNMWVDMLEEINKNDLLPNVKWDVVIDSSKVNLQKPNKNMFVYATKKSRVKASEILFIDNNLENIETARSMDWNVFLYDSSNYLKASEDLLTFYRSLR